LIQFSAIRFVLNYYTVASMVQQVLQFGYLIRDWSISHILPSVKLYTSICLY